MKEDPVLHWDEVFGKYASIPDLTISLRQAGVRFTRANHSICIAWENVGKPHHWLAAMFLLDEHHLPRVG